MSEKKFHDSCIMVQIWILNTARTVMMTSTTKIASAMMWFVGDCPQLHTASEGRSYLVNLYTILLLLKLIFVNSYEVCN